jgi:hypothetical protein
VGGVRRIHSLKSSALKRKSLIFVRCIDYSPRYGEINHPVKNLIGSRVLMEQLAPRKNAKAPRSVFVGSSTMEMDQ